MPTIETERLLLRMFRPEDLDELASLLSDPDVVKYVGDGNPVGREEADKALQSIIKHWETHGFGRWAAIDKATIRIILARLLGLDLGSFRYRLACPVGSVSIVEFSSQGPMLRALADRSHLSEALQSLPGT